MAKCPGRGYGSRMGTIRIAFFGVVLAVSGLGWACSSPDDNDAVKVDAVAPVGTGAPDSGGDASDAGPSSVDAADGAPALPTGWCGVPPANSVPASVRGIGWLEGASCAASCGGNDALLYTVYSPGGELLRPARVDGCAFVSAEKDVSTWCCPHACRAGGGTQRCKDLGVGREAGLPVQFDCPNAKLGTPILPAPMTGCELVGRNTPLDGFDMFCCPAP